MSVGGIGPALGATVETRIERVAYGGEGVARVDGLVVFVPWSAPEDRVRATVVERHPRWARARLDAVLAEGPARTVPGCPVFGDCGGCQLQHLEIGAQRRAKGEAVADALTRIAGRALPDPVPCEPAAAPWSYRQRAVFSWRRSDAGTVVGFHAAAEPDRLVPVAACPIFAAEGNARLPALFSALAGAPPASEGRLAVRVLPEGSVQAGAFALEPAVARQIAKAWGGAADGATWGRWSPGSGALTLDRQAPRLAARIDYRGLKLRVGFDSFLQANLEAAERLYDAVLEALDPQPGERIVDGYAGVGVVACELASRGARVTAVEAHRGAAGDLRSNAAAAGVDVEVIERTAERVDWIRPRPEAVLLNPPRGGVPPAALASIGRSSARRLVYVACDPATLARDLRRLGDAWRLDAVRAFDLFPQTAHVETLARLSRGPAT